MMNIQTLLAILLILAATPVVASPPLQHNPFKKPANLGAIQKIRSESSPDAPFSLPTVRATLVGKTGPLALIGGEVVAVGATVNGYRLVAVREGAAVFERGGVMQEVTVRNVGAEATEDEEQSDAY